MHTKRNKSEAISEYFKMCSFSSCSSDFVEIKLKIEKSDFLKSYLKWLKSNIWHQLNWWKKRRVKFRLRIWYSRHFLSKWKKSEPKRCYFGLVMPLFPGVPKLQIERPKFWRIWKRRYLENAARMSVEIFQLWSIDRAFQGLQNAYIV